MYHPYLQEQVARAHYQELVHEAEQQQPLLHLRPCSEDEVAEHVRRVGPRLRVVGHLDRVLVSVGRFPSQDDVIDLYALA